MTKRAPHGRRDRLGRAPRGFAACVALAALLVAAIARVDVDCSASSTGVAFATYEPALPTANDSTGTVSVVCTYVSGGASQINYRVLLSTGSSGTYAARRLVSGSNRLNYNLYTDATRTVVWGNGLGGTAAISGTFTIGPGVGNGLRQDDRTVYGRMPARQDALDGGYTDTIVVTLEF